MTELPMEKIALIIAKKARLLALEAESLYVVSSDPGVAREALERINESEQGLTFWIDQLKKVAEK